MFYVVVLCSFTELKFGFEAQKSNFGTSTFLLVFHIDLCVQAIKQKERKIILNYAIHRIHNNSYVCGTAVYGFFC